MTTETKVWSEPDVLHHRGLCSGRQSLPETGTDDCPICVRPVEGSSVGCRRCADFDENDLFVQWLLAASGAQKLPKHINFALDGPIGGVTANREFNMDLPPLGDYSRAGHQTFRQAICDSVPSSGILKHPSAMADLAKRAWELGVHNLRNTYDSAQECYEAYENPEQSLGCNWYMADIKSVSKAFCAGKSVSTTEFSKTWTFVCKTGAPIVHINYNDHNDWRTDMLVGKTGHLITSMTDVINIEPQEWHWPQRGAEFFVAGGIGTLNHQLFVGWYAGGEYTLSGTPFQTGRYQNGNYRDLISEIAGNGRAGGLASAGDTSFPFDSTRTWWWFSTGDPSELDNPAYYAQNCRAVYKHRSYLDVASYDEGYAFVFTNVASPVQGAGNTAPDGGGTPAWLDLYAILGQTLQQNVVTKLGYPLVLNPGISSYGPRLAGEVVNNHPGGTGECVDAVYTPDQMSFTYTTHDCPLDPVPEWFRLNTVTAIAPVVNGFGIGGCCNLYKPVYYGIPRVGTYQTGNFTFGRIANEQVPTDYTSGTSPHWIASHWWGGASALNFSCELYFDSSSFTSSGLFYTFDELNLYKSQVGLPTGIAFVPTANTYSVKIATWRVTRSLAHCDESVFNLELVWAANQDYGRTVPFGKPSHPTVFPATGLLWW